MKVTVLGAGAVGSMIGGLIKYNEPSLDVLLVGRGEHAEVVTQRQGVCLLGPWGMHDVRLRAALSVDTIAGSDVVFVTTKAQDTDQALAAAKPYLDDALVISIQNGVNDHIFEQFVPREQLVMGVTLSRMAVVQPGTVGLQRNGFTVVGPSRDGVNHLASCQARKLLRLTGMKVIEHPNVLGVRYNQLVVNALGVSFCLSETNFVEDTIGHMLWHDYIGSPLLEESLETLRRARIRLSRIPGSTDTCNVRQAFRMLNKPVLGRIVRVFSERFYGSKRISFSLAQDLQRGKKTEVDEVNGHLVRLASSIGFDVPYNQLVQASVHELESHRGAKSRSEHSVLRRFQSFAQQPRLRIAG